MNCLLCSSTNIKFKFVFSGDDIYLKKLNVKDFDLKWYSCKDCGVYFSEQYEKIEDVYQDENLYDASFDKDLIKIRFDKIMNLEKRNSDNVKRVLRCKEYHKNYVNTFDIKKEEYNILDIGAGLGVFLANFLDANYIGHALELNKIASNHILKVLPSVTVYQDFMQNLQIKNKFDLITLNRVLEHISSPIAVMTEVVNALLDNGLVYVELPDSLSYELNGESNEAFSSGHYMVYNSKSLNYIFTEVGLELMKLERLQEPSGKYTVYAIARKKNEIL